MLQKANYWVCSQAVRSKKKFNQSPRFCVNSDGVDTWILGFLAVISLIVFGNYNAEPLEILLPGGFLLLFGTQRRILFRLRSHPAQQIVELDVSRFFPPQGAIVIKGGNSFFLRNKIRTAWCGDSGYKIQDGLFCKSFIPRL